MKKRLTLLIAAGILGTTSVIFASTVKTPANVLSTLTGKTVEDLEKERLAGKTYGSMAAESGKLEEFHDEMLKQKREILDQKVKDGDITQEEADSIYNRMENNQSICDGTGNARLGQGSGMGLGLGRGMRNGMGLRRGMGLGCGGR